MPCFSSFLARIWWNFFNWCKTINILQEKYFPHKYDKNMAYFYEKPEGLDWETWNFSWRHKRSVVKKHLKIIFFSVQPFIVKMQFEIWKYLPSKLFLPKYLSCRLHNSVQLVPTHFILFFVKFIFYRSSRGGESTAIYLRRNNNVSCLYEVISSLKYILKVKLHPNIHPNILSEIIGLHENEGRGGILAKISNWQLYIGRAA